MLRTPLFLLPLVACTAPDDTAKGGDDAPPLAQPFLAFTAPVDPGYLRSTCTLALDLYDTGGTLLDSVEIPAQGREWTGLPLTVGALYTATARWDYCNNYDSGTGELPSSSAFSGEAGDLLVYYYNGVSAAFDTLHQERDFNGGAISIAFDAEADPAAVAAAHDLASRENSDGTWAFSWEDDQSPAAVLAALTLEAGYAEGAPSWVKAPDWW